MLLAAGRGSRMGDLTKDIPKPLLPINGTSLIAHQVMSLAQHGFQEIIINTSMFGEKIHTHLGDGQQFGVKILYSVEEEPLETGGGIHKALPLLGDKPFLIAGADIYTEYPYAELYNKSLDGQAHLVMVPNPSFHPKGDFVLTNGQLHDSEASERCTYSCIAVIDPKLFNDTESGSFPIAPLLRKAMTDELVSGELYTGTWMNVGTPEDLCEAEQLLSKQNSLSETSEKN